MKLKKKTYFVGSFKASEVDLPPTHRASSRNRFTAWTLCIKGDKESPFVDVCIQNGFIVGDLKEAELEIRHQIYKIVREGYKEIDNYSGKLINLKKIIEDYGSFFDIIEITDESSRIVYRSREAKNIPWKIKKQYNIDDSNPLRRYNFLYLPERIEMLFRPRIILYYVGQKNQLRYPFYENGKITYIKTKGHTSNYRNHGFDTHVDIDNYEKIFDDKIQSPERQGIFYWHDRESTSAGNWWIDYYYIIRTSPIKIKVKEISYGGQKKETRYHEVSINEK